MRSQFNIRLPESHINRLRRIAEDTGLSQSEVIMRLIDAAQARHNTVGALGGIFMPLGASVTMLESADLSFDEAHDHVHRSEYTVRHDTEVGYYLDGQMAVKFE